MQADLNEILREILIHKVKIFPTKNRFESGEMTKGRQNILLKNCVGEIYHPVIVQLIIHVLTFLPR